MNNSSTLTTQVCKVCGRDLPLGNFQRGRHGSHLGVCKDCMKKKISEGQRKKIAEAKKPDAPKKEPVPVAKIVEVDVPTNLLAKAEDATLIAELKRRGYAGTLTKTFTI